MPDFKKLFYDSQVDLVNVEEALEELLYQVRCAMQRAEEQVIKDEYPDSGEDWDSKNAQKTIENIEDL